MLKIRPINSFSLGREFDLVYNTYSCKWLLLTRSRKVNHKDESLRNLSANETRALALVLQTFPGCLLFTRLIHFIMVVQYCGLLTMILT